MAIRLGENNYGKSRVRLLRVLKQEGRHDIREVTLSIAFEGDFESAHSEGDNRKILPTDTMKNTVYILARQYPIEAVEDFCAHVIEHFLTYNPQVTRVRLEASEIPWARIPMGGKPHPSAFLLAGPERRTAKLAGTPDGTSVRAGSFPISIDPQLVAARAAHAASTRRAARLRDSLSDQRLVIGVDRLDYTKGLMHRFDAVERLLEGNPQYRR